MRSGVAILALACGVARAQDERAATRVVLADPDPELRRAVETSLKPWKIEVVVEPAPPEDTTAANERATESAARFVVWRDGSDLVVFDHDSGAAERRAASAGAFDAVGAAAAALTVKTMMRLPPPPDEQKPIEVVERGLELRLQAGFATRYARGSETDIGGRFTAVGLVRPFPAIGFGIGAAIDLGTEPAIDSGGFKGNWRDWAVLAVASWTFAIDQVEIEPWLASGLVRSTMIGLQNQVPREEDETLASVRGGVWVRRRFGRWSIGGELSVESTLGTPTYTKPDQARAIVFEVPSFGVVGGVIVAADLAP